MLRNIVARLMNATAIFYRGLASTITSIIITHTRIK